MARKAEDPLSVADPAAPKPRRKSGTSVRGTAGWDDPMIAVLARRLEAKDYEAEKQEIDVGDDDDSDESAAKPAKRGKRATKKSAAKEAASRPAKQARAKAAKATKQAWPKDLAEQTRAVRGVLAAAGEVVTAADLARQFKHAKAPRVEEILATLVAIGHARRTDTGYAPA